MATWGLLILDAIILSTVSVFSLVCVSHIIAGWLLRKHFQMAIRSPLLLTMSGTAGVCLLCATIVQVIIFDSTEPGATQLVLIPLKITFNTSAYFLRGIRLLVMYNPNLRGRYGPYIKEVTMVKALATSFGVMEALAWSLSLVFGVGRIASFTMIVIVVDVVVTVWATLALMVKLRTTNDLFDMSSEIQSVGVCLLASLALVAVFFVVPSYIQRYIKVGAMFARYFATMWKSNICPVRSLAWRRVGSGGSPALWFPYVPWRNPSGKAVIVAGYANLSRTSITLSSGGIDWLDSIMGFPPLLRAFSDYCRKALCTESLFFLIEVSEIVDSLEAATAYTSTAVHFERFQAAVDKYIKDGSPFEINICFKTKAAVLKVVDSESFQRLTLVEMAQVLAPAAKEVGDMLKDNVYNNFCATVEYRQIASTIEDLVQKK